MARLTDKQREDIRNQLILGESQYSIARDYEVSSATVNKIFNNMFSDSWIKGEWFKLSKSDLEKIQSRSLRVEL